MGFLVVTLGSAQVGLPDTALESVSQELVLWPFGVTCNALLSCAHVLLMCLLILVATIPEKSFNVVERLVMAK